MTAINRAWSNMTVLGRVLLPLALLVFVVGPILTVLVAVFLGPFLVDLLSANIDIVRFVVAVTGILLFSIPAAFIIIYMEMKVIALMNLRIGPDRVGPAGSLLSVVHGLKVLMKEDFTPTGADKIVFTWAPVIVFLTAVMTFLVIPFGPGLVGQDLNIGLLYLFAVGGMTVVGLLMAGWSSFNKYSLLGGLRSAAQVVSYEIPLTLSVVGLILLAGTMSVYTLAETQSGGFWDWFVFRQPLGALIFFIAATAEANRTPFDLTEADSEIVAGFATEYSGMRFGFLFFAEYVNVFIISALMVTFYFGAWHAPFPFPDVNLGLDLGSLGIGLLLILAIGARRPHPAVRAAVLADVEQPAGLAGAGPRLPRVQRRGDRPRVRDRLRRAATGSPGSCGSWSNRSCSCTCSSGCGARCPGSGSTS